MIQGCQARNCLGVGDVALPSVRQQLSTQGAHWGVTTQMQKTQSLSTLMVHMKKDFNQPQIHKYIVNY